MACNAFAILVVTDGTTRIDLLNCGRWMLTAWDPFIPGAKGGGTWQDSPLSPGRQLIDYQRTNWIDVFTLTLQQPTQDGVIFQEQELLRLMEKAIQYWTSRWQNEPVWIEAKAALETNTRYAVIKSYDTPSGSGNPFGQPFILTEPKSIIEDYQLTIEHGPWLADEPGTGTCVEISGKQTSWPYHLVFAQGASEVNCGSNGLIDNLPSGNFTIEAWIKAAGWGGATGGTGYIFNKGAWWVAIDSGTGVVAQAVHAVQDAQSYSGLDDFIPDDQWHHIAVTFGAAQFRIWIDGVEVSYGGQTAAIGAYAGDAADDLFIGNWAAGTGAFNGRIGWCRLSILALRYVANFTPPPRCTFPDIDVFTNALWVGIEKSGATIDNQQGNANLDGTQTDCTFDTDCEWGRDETCLDEVYIANKHNVSQLTHIYVDDGGVFGANLFGAATPFDLLPAVPVANDAVYFGINTALVDTGPFCSLIFDIGTAIAGVTGLVWEYWNGAWVALTVQDNTNADGAMTGIAFDTTGVGSVHWEQPSGWATVAVNGVTGYWVRARVTVAAGATAPTQQNRAIYSILWPYVEAALDQVGGDIGVLIQARIDNQSDDDFGNALEAWQNRVVVGTRLLSRGANFTPFINLADEQNPSGITVTPFGVGAFITDAQAPTGRALFCTNPAAQAGIAQITLDSSILLEYDGVFHAFIRGEQLGAISLIEMQLFINVGGVAVFESPVVTFPDGGSFNIADLGQIEINSIIGGIAVNEIDIELRMAGNGVQDSTLYELVLMPVDEWACDTITPFNSAGIALGGRGDTVDDRSYLIIDSITSPREGVFSAAALFATNFITGKWQYISPKAVMLQSNAIQRIWFLSSYFDDPANTDQKSTAWIADTVRITGSQMYLYARGAR